MNTGFGQYGEMNNAWTSDDAERFHKNSRKCKNIFSSVNDISYD
jgi:argininosuccinate synthase